jgi:hypothetical protein
VLQLLNERVFTKEDVFERLDGHCRLLPPLTVELGSTAPLWAKRMRPILEHVTRRLNGVGGSWQDVVETVTSVGVRQPRRGKKAVVRGFARLGRGRHPKGTSARALHLRKIRAAHREWDEWHGRPDPQVFTDTILPKLAAVPLKLLRATTGLSRTLCYEIRRGQVVPHPRHWDALVRLTRP